MGGGHLVLPHRTTNHFKSMIECGGLLGLNLIPDHHLMDNYTTTLPDCYISKCECMFLAHHET